MLSNRNIFLLGLFIFILMINTSCSKDVNKVLYRMKIQSNMYISDVTKDSFDKIVVLSGNLSEKEILKYCNHVRNNPKYEFWEIALLFIDENSIANVYIIHPFHGTLETLELDIQITQGKEYEAKNIKIERIDENRFRIFSCKM